MYIYGIQIKTHFFPFGPFRREWGVRVCWNNVGIASGFSFLTGLRPISSACSKNFIECF